MSRIDAKIATQVADVVRPVDRDRQARLQVEAASRRAIGQTDRPLIEPTAGGDDSLHSAIQQVKAVVEAASGRQLQFNTHERSRELLVQVKDMTTGEVIRQIPSKEILAMRDRIADLVGMMLDKKA